jgi:DNA-binding MarR family transcriptional regulator
VAEGCLAIERHYTNVNLPAWFGVASIFRLFASVSINPFSFNKQIHISHLTALHRLATITIRRLSNCFSRCTVTEESNAELLAFFKALSDKTRLQIVGLLAQESYSGEQLAAIMKVKPATISHHLGKLAEAGLVTVESSGHSRLYRLRLDSMQDLAGRLSEKDALPRLAEDLDVDVFDRKVVQDYSRRDGSLKEIPAQQKKLQAILRHIVRSFDPEQKYPEKQVNEIISHFHADTASLRRALIDTKMMQRANGIYWRTS